jgi:valyl-tRNA synthetase
MGARPFAIVIPPPNVTGSLHMGHALNNTLQDVVVRFERMRGRDVLWQPGMDHAGIATQMVVERQLMERQEPNRRDLGRDEFVRRVWQWKVESGGLIESVEAARRLLRLVARAFTMDEGSPARARCSSIFTARAHLQGQAPRRWDPKLLTAISDLEVEQVEVKGHLWHLRYPLEDRTFDANDPSTYIVVATTRPETMPGDTAVAVHPDDERYKSLVGKHVILPLVGRRIPIVADEYSDPEKGSGAVKITPAHDFNDFEVGKRHALPQVNILSPEAELLLEGKPDFTQGVEPNPELTQTIQELHGLDRFAARKPIVTRLEEHGLVEKIEPYVHTVPHGDRSTPSSSLSSPTNGMWTPRPWPSRQ